MVRYAFQNDKGGVGKTTTSANVAVGLAQRGKKVLLADLDGQGDATKSILGARPPEIKPGEETPQTMYHLLVGEANFDQVVITAPRYPEIDVLPANRDLSRRAPLVLANLPGGATVFKKVLDQLPKDRYDYVLIDTGKGLDLLLINALAAAESVIIMVTPGPMELDAVPRAIEHVDEVRRETLQGAKTPKVKGILLTEARKSGDPEAVTVTQSARQTLQENYPDLLMKSEIPYSEDYKKALSRSVSIFEFSARKNPSNKPGEKYTARGTRVAEAYDQLVEELINYG